MLCEPTRLCELLVGLGDVEVLGVEDEAGAPLRIPIRWWAPSSLCGGCGGSLWSNGAPRSTPPWLRPARSRTFQLMGLANNALDEARGRVHSQALGHSGHKHDPHYWAGQMLVPASECITGQCRTKRCGLRDAWHARETNRSIEVIDATDLGAATVNQLAQDLQDPGLPLEITGLRRTTWLGRPQISLSSTPPGSPRDPPKRRPTW